MRPPKPRIYFAGLMTLVCGCTPMHGRPGEKAARRGDEIVVAGQFFHTTAPVVLWTDPGGYDAYRGQCRFRDDILPSDAGENPSPNRYDSFRRNLAEDVAAKVRDYGWTLDDLQDAVDLLVIHYDACGTSRRCFEVLHDERGLSVHFMLDLDGTIYQTLDVKERARHAGTANDRSVGIEIANIGAYPDRGSLDAWYREDRGGGTYIHLSAEDAASLHKPGHRPRPARPKPVQGIVQGKKLNQYDLTEAQYDSLIKLTATLCRVFPRIKPDYPRDTKGRLRTTALTSDEFTNFHGLIGHFHVEERKVDPGPAFDWDRLLNGVRRSR